MDTFVAGAFLAFLDGMTCFWQRLEIKILRKLGRRKARPEVTRLHFGDTSTSASLSGIRLVYHQSWLTGHMLLGQASLKYIGKEY